MPLREIESGFKTPEKKINTAADILLFQQSVAFKTIEDVILHLASQIANSDIPVTSSKPEVISILNILNEIDRLVDETPPYPGPRRYGNAAAREWHSKLPSVEPLVRSMLQLHPLEEEEDFINESMLYLLGSFGSSVRLDYGTGHELSFVAWLGTLFLSHHLPLSIGNDLLVILQCYYNLTMKLIKTYTLEPAGSHGVWGLDDHFHLIYFFGACQMITFDSVFSNSNISNTDLSQLNTISESSISMDGFKQPRPVNTQTRIVAPLPSYSLKKALLPTLSKSNLYFQGINFIYEIKLGPFQEHSPMLTNIAAATAWEKVARGLWRLWGDEVIGKWTVVQHFWFGSIYPWINKNGRELPISKAQAQTKTKKVHSKKVDNTGRLGRHERVMTGAPWARRG